MNAITLSYTYSQLCIGTHSATHSAVNEFISILAVTLVLRALPLLIYLSRVYDQLPVGEVAQEASQQTAWSATLLYSSPPLRGSTFPAALHLSLYFKLVVAPTLVFYRSDATRDC